MLLKIMTYGLSIEYKRFSKTRQGLPLGGNWITSEDGNSGWEGDSNFHQLLLLHANDDSNLLDIMKRKTNIKNTDHSI